MVVVKREAGAAESPCGFYRVCASQDHINPIQMYQRKTVEHFPLGFGLTEALITSPVVWLRSK